MLQFCILSGRCLIISVYFANTPSQHVWEEKLGKPNEEIGNLNRFECMFLMLEECNPIVLVLVLMLVLVGRPSAGARGSKKSVLLAFLLSIRLLQNYEHSIILEWATQGNDDVTRSLDKRSRFRFYTRSLPQRSHFCFNRSTWVRTHKKTLGNETSVS